MLITGLNGTLAPKLAQAMNARAKADYGRCKIGCEEVSPPLCEASASASVPVSLPCLERLRA